MLLDFAEFASEDDCEVCAEFLSRRIVFDTYATSRKSRFVASKDTDGGDDDAGGRRGGNDNFGGGVFERRTMVVV